MLNSIKNYFNFKEAGTTFKKEIIGGLSTFMAMAYILAVNPGMLSNAAGGHYAGVFFLGTAVSALFGTMLMGLYAKVPLALAPGMGVNAFFTYTVATGVLNIGLEAALVATFISGILYMIIAVTPLRQIIANLLPKNIKLAIGAMIGLFLAYIGLNDSGIIVSDATSPGFLPPHGVMSATATKLGNLADPFVIISCVTLLLVFVLHFMKVKGAALIAMLSAVIMLAIAKGAGVADASNAFTLNDYKSFGEFKELSTSMWSSFGKSLSNGKIYIAIFVFLYVDFFDTTGSLFAIGRQANVDKRKDFFIKANAVDAASTMFGSMMLTSTTTTYIESSVGVSQGARTGFASIVTGLCFALAIAMWPVMSPIMPIIHSQAGVASAHADIMPVTGPILVLVGSLMLSQLKHFDWGQTIDIPTLFLILTIGMLSYSISTGIAVGIIMHYIMNWVLFIRQLIKKKPSEANDMEIVMSNDVKKVDNHEPTSLKKRLFNPIMIGMFILSITYFATMPLYAY